MAISLEDIAFLDPIFTEDYKPHTNYETLQQKYKSLTGENFVGLRDAISFRNYGEYEIFEMKDFIVARRDGNSSIYEKPADFKATPISIEGLKCVWDSELQSEKHSVFWAYRILTFENVGSYNAIAYEKHSANKSVYEMSNYIVVFNPDGQSCIYQR